VPGHTRSHPEHGRQAGIADDIASREKVGIAGFLLAPASVDRAGAFFFVMLREPRGASTAGKPFRSARGPGRAGSLTASGSHR
jgi:hypothetical protein